MGVRKRFIKRENIILLRCVFTCVLKVFLTDKREKEVLQWMKTSLKKCFEKRKN